MKRFDIVIRLVALRGRNGLGCVEFIEQGNTRGIADPIGVPQSVAHGVSRFTEFARLAEVPGANADEIAMDLARRARQVTECAPRP